MDVVRGLNTVNSQRGDRHLLVLNEVARPLAYPGEEIINGIFYL